MRMGLFFRRDFMLTQAPKGTRDMLPQDAYIWQTIEAVMRRRAAQIQ